MQEKIKNKGDRMLKNILSGCSRDFKSKIIEMIGNIPFSKQMIGSFLFIPEPQLSEYIDELLDENLILQVGFFRCVITEKEQPFYGTEKLLYNFNNPQNGHS